MENERFTGLILEVGELDVDSREQRDELQRQRFEAGGDQVVVGGTEMARRVSQLLNRRNVEHKCEVLNLRRGLSTRKLSTNPQSCTSDDLRRFE